jgi:hypothetical protein
MKHLSNFKKFSINENRLILEGLENPEGIELTPEDHKKLGGLIDKYLNKSFSKGGSGYNPFNGFASWVGRDYDGPRSNEDVASGEMDEYSTAYRNWIYFLGCSLTPDNPRYDAIRVSMTRPSGKFKSMKFTDGTELMLFDDETFKKFLKICQQIVGESGIEKEMNVEKNPNAQEEPKALPQGQAQGQAQQPKKGFTPNVVPGKSPQIYTPKY